LETRAAAFAAWLGFVGFNDKSLKSWSLNTAKGMICTYLHFIATKGPPKFSRKGPPRFDVPSSRTDPLQAQTLMGYAKGAELWCSHVMDLQVLGAISDGKDNDVKPFIAEIIKQRRAWAKPKEKKEPITLAMYDNAQVTCKQAVAADPNAFLDRLCAVHNWTSLGVFTGSRVGEYAQSKPTKGVPFARIPLNEDAGEWAGQPLAFIRSDFSFFDKTGRQLSTTNIAILATSATEVHIRFRYDKSPTNFSVRKFKKTGHHFLCPCLASIAIFFRANLLQVPTDQPIGVFRKLNERTGFRFLSNNDVTDELRATCLRTYPDPDHYMHKHIKCIMAHSVRVTACVALHAAGESEFVIAFRLRWTPQSVMHYIRDCAQQVGDLCQAVLSGAGRL
jgi:hypothetical protein